MLFVLTAIDRDNGLELRKSVRDAHLAFLKETGAARLGGPFLGADGNMAGSMLVFEAEDLNTAKAWCAADPYAKAGLFKSTDLRAWKMTVNNCEAKL